MTNRDRRCAFDMRLAGCTWEEIAEQLGYSRSTVVADMQRCLSRSGLNLCRVPFPALRRYISYYHEGNLSAFCRELGVPPQQGRRMLRGESPMTGDFVARVRERTGLLYAEITRKEDNTHGTMAM